MIGEIKQRTRYYYPLSKVKLFLYHFFEALGIIVLGYMNFLVIRSDRLNATNKN